MTKKFRLYIDESGTAAYQNNPIERYLTLCGIIIDNQTNIEAAHKLDDIKAQFFKSFDIDNPTICLHRTDIIRKKNAFSCLTDENVRSAFDKALLQFLSNIDFHIISTTFDKIAIAEKYGDRKKHPYEYSMDVLLKRYALFLNDNNARGDVMIECRNKNDDTQIKKLYNNYYLNGQTSFFTNNRVRELFTSSEIKLKNKAANICGLQIADLISKQIQLITLFEYAQISDYRKTNFTDELEKIIYPKIRQKNNVRRGYGIILCFQ